MHIELIDTLRCPHPHEPAGLVAAVDQWVGRDVLVGTLGCPTCDARFPIVGGAVVFDEALRFGAQSSGQRPLAARPDGALVRPPVGAPESAELTEWLGAALDLSTPGGVVLLHGRWAPAAAALQRLTNVSVITLNPLADAALPTGVTPLYAAVAPVKAGSLRAAALDAPAAGTLVASVIAALKPRARLLGAPGISVPPEVHELAQSEHGWVGELVAIRTTSQPSAPVSLRRAGRAQTSE